MTVRPYSKQWFDDQFRRTGKDQAAMFHFMSERFGLDRSQVNKTVNGKRRPQPNEILELLRWLDVTDVGGVTTNYDALVGDATESIEPINTAALMKLHGPTNFPDMGPRDVPIRQIATGGDDGDFIFSDEPLDFARRPHALLGQRVIGAYVTGDSMSPRYEPGDPVYAYVARPAVPGDYVIVEMHPDTEAGERKGFIKRLVRKSSSKVVCEQFNPRKEIVFQAERVARLYRIVPPAELFG